MCLGYVCTIWVRVDLGGLGVVGFGMDKKSCLYFLVYFIVDKKRRKNCEK